MFKTLLLSSVLSFLQFLIIGLSHHLISCLLFTPGLLSLTGILYSLKAFPTYNIIILSKLHCFTLISILRKFVISNPISKHYFTVIFTLDFSNLAPKVILFYCNTIILHQVGNDLIFSSNNNKIYFSGGYVDNLS